MNKKPLCLCLGAGWRDRERLSAGLFVKREWEEAPRVVQLLGWRPGKCHCSWRTGIRRQVFRSWEERVMEGLPSKGSGAPAERARVTRVLCLLSVHPLIASLLDRFCESLGARVGRRAKAQRTRESAGGRVVSFGPLTQRHHALSFCSSI